MDSGIGPQILDEAERGKRKEESIMSKQDCDNFEPVIYLGGNLNRAIVQSDSGRIYLVLDGRERKNPSAFVRHGVEGIYEVTRTSGAAPGDVDYWGRKVDKMG